MKKADYIFFEGLWSGLPTVWKLVLSNCLRDDYQYNISDPWKYKGLYEAFPGPKIDAIRRKRKLKISFYSDSGSSAEEELNLGVMPHFFPDLEELELSAVTLQSLEGLEKCRSLKDLKIESADNMTSGYTCRNDCSADPIGGCKELERLWINGDLGCVHVDVERIAQLSRLKSLRLQNTLVSKITESDIQHLNDLRHLSELDLCKTEVQSLEPIWGLPLQTLIVSGKISVKELAAYQRDHPEVEIGMQQGHHYTTIQTHRKW